MRMRLLGWAAAAAFGAGNGHAAAPVTDLQPVDAVLARVGKATTVQKAGESDAARLLADISDFRRRSSDLPPQKAAAAWLALWDRARLIDPRRVASDYDAYDISVRAAVGLRSVIAALPSPEAWPAVRKLAEARVAKKPDDASELGLRLISEALTRDTQAVRKSLDRFDRLLEADRPAERDVKRASIDQARALVYRLYGSKEEIAEGFRASIDAQARNGYGFVDVPDLVGLLGADKAEALLTEVLRKPVLLQISQGEATRSLARQVALNGIDLLRKPQWGLIDNVGTAALYEAMQKRFDPAAGSANTSTEEADPGIDYLRQRADLYYFLDLVIAGRQEEAERAMVRATGRGTGFSIPKQAMAELIRNGNNEAVYAYLAKLLERRPQVPAWDVYLEQAAYLGHAKDAMTLLDRILKRSDLPPYLRAELQSKRLDALLGADRIGEAAAGFRSLLAVAPSSEDPKLSERSAAAVRLAALGRILKQPALAETGFAFAQRAVALPTKAQNEWRPGLLRSLLAELRRQGRFNQAQALALAELERESGDPRNAGLTAIVVDPSKRAALVELTGLYDGAGRSADVMRMLDEVGTWGARDLSALMAESDSLGTALGLMAARAFKASGNTAAAKASVLALLDQFPGYDSAYQLYVDLDPERAIDELERRHSLDRFEERPLIWKASVQRMTRQYDAAELTIRRAIAIDPSDGEQGPNDRMRAYAVLADILEAKGDAKSAQTYRNAVSAIRVSEQADELHKLGLYQRAFSAYRAALGEFSDAYCIQSRLAVQLGKLGFQDEALKHYRRAFELMPDSFGRVESHCFGCESVFAGPSAQAIADQVFTSLIQKGSLKPQAPYMLGYLRMEQGRYDEAVVLFRQVIALDHEYLNAWKHLYELGDKTYIQASERDIARLRLFELDPRQLHVSYRLDEVSDLSALWRALALFEAEQARLGTSDQVYTLVRSAQDRDETLAKMPVDSRAQFERYVSLQDKMSGQTSRRTPAPSLANHTLLLAVLALMGDHGGSELDE